MPYIKEIASIINTELQASTLGDKRFKKGSFYSVVKLIKRETENNNATIPSIISNNGTCTPIVIDDTKPFMLYHRVLDLAYTLGDSNGDERLITETATVRIVVYGKRNILQLEQELLVAAVQGGMLQELSATDKNTYKLQKCSIEIADINLNSEDVYNEEYSGDVNYHLKPNDILFSLNYIITSEYDKSCVDIC